MTILALLALLGAAQALFVTLTIVTIVWEG